MTHPTTPERPRHTTAPSPHSGRHHPSSGAQNTTRIVAAVLATITATLALAWFITATPARGDALCDAMRARFGPGYPCISVPTNTFTPTAPAGPTTTNPNGSTGSGPQVSIDTGPGPGVGNGTPIVPVPGTPTNAAPGTNPAPAATPTTPQIPTGPTPASQQTGQPAPSATRQPPSTATRPTPSSTTPAPVGTSAPTQTASIPTTGDNSWDETTQMLWLLAGAAAIIAGATSTRSGGVGRYRAAATANGYPTITSALRSWLPGGGSERARIGNSQYVLINDPTSPREYVFHENVPPGGHMSVNPDGSATIYNRDGQPVGSVSKPWAYDSLGRPQKTWYTVDDNGNLVQHIDAEPNALYPILADPDINTLKRVKQQQQAANQGTPAHQEGTGTPLNKSPNADPPPQPPPTPQPDTSSSNGSSGNGEDNPGLRNLITGPINNQPTQPEQRSSTQGPTPAPGQNLGYDDFLNNQLGEQHVGTIDQRPGPDGTNQYLYIHHNADGSVTENKAIAAPVTDDGHLLYVLDNGSILDPNVHDGISAITHFDKAGNSITDFSTGEQLVIHRDGSGEWTPPPDWKGSALTSVFEGLDRFVDNAAAAAQPGRHALNAAEAATAAEWLGRFGKIIGPAGIAAAATSGAIALAAGKPVPETVGGTSGGIIGGALGGAAGAGAGAFFTGAVIGASAGSAVPVVGTIIGGLVGAGVGALVGTTYGANIGHGARVAWKAIFG